MAPVLGRICPEYWIAEISRDESFHHQQWDALFQREAVRPVVTGDDEIECLSGVVGRGGDLLSQALQDYLFRSGKYAVYMMRACVLVPFRIRAAT